MLLDVANLVNCILSHHMFALVSCLSWISTGLDVNFLDQVYKLVGAL
jgi:hypothetical protein